MGDALKIETNVEKITKMSLEVYEMLKKSLEKTRLGIFNIEYRIHSGREEEYGYN